MGVSAKRKRSILVFLVSLLWIIGCPLDVHCDPQDRTAQMQKVKDTILRNYDRFVRPTNGTNTTEVLTSFIPRQIIEVDEERTLFSLDSYIWMNWVDLRLQWNSSDYDGYLQLPSTMIWVPDISVWNSHSLRIDPIQEVLLAISSVGEVWWVPPVFTQTTCPSLNRLEIPSAQSYFSGPPGEQSSPLSDDEVECIIRVGSWMHDGWEVDFFHSDYLWLDEFEDVHSRWEIIKEKTRANRNVTIFECCPEPYIRIDFVITMRRRPDPAVEATRTPCVLVMVLTLGIFWLPPESSKKLVLGGFLFVTLNVLLAYVGLSTRGPLMVLSSVSFLRTAMYLMATTLLLQVLVVMKIASFTGPTRPPAAIMQFLTGSLGKYACLWSPSSADKVSVDRMQLKEDSSTGQSLTIRDEWRLLASVVDRALFLVMTVVMAAVHHL